VPGRIHRTQPGLPMKPGKCGTHDYIRYGTTTLFAALNVQTGTVILSGPLFKSNLNRI